MFATFKEIEAKKPTITESPPLMASNFYYSITVLYSVNLGDYLGKVLEIPNLQKHRSQN